MGTFKTLCVAANYFLARIAPKFSINQLVDALGCDDEDSAATAYIVLVKLGPKYADILLLHARGGHNAVDVIQVLGDIGTQELIPDLELFFAKSDDPEIVQMMHESIQAIRDR